MKKRKKHTPVTKDEVSREQMGSGVNTCVMCGAVIPEGDMVCKFCRSEVLGEDEQVFKRRR